MFASHWNKFEGEGMPPEQSDKPQCQFEPDTPTTGVLQLVRTYRGLVPEAVRTVRVLGHGRAAEARLVEATLADAKQLFCVEKVFRPALLTRIIYRIAFQSAFAYQTCQNAILASFYRRRVASAIVEGMGDGIRVAEPLYVRWDIEAQAFVLAAEFIRGRGILPQAPDPYSMRRWLARWVQRKDRYPERPGQEITELLETMSKLETLFRQCGLEGCGWQVCKRAMVSTANLIRTASGYIVVDLESGIPAVLVPSYVVAGLRIGALPLFDDVNVPRLRNWLVSHANRLIHQLGRSRYDLLVEDAERLIGHTEAWKRSELAIGRNKWRVLGRECREQFKARCLDLWRRREIIDEATEARLQPGRRIFSRLTFLLGLVPGAAGRFLQRICANREYRIKVGRLLHDGEFRRAQFGAFVRKYEQRWRSSSRIAPDRHFGHISLRFVLNGLLAAFTPAGVHRWFSDPVQRRNVLVRMWLICVSARFQSEYGRHLIRTWIRQWEDSGRLTPREAMQLRRQLCASDMDEYVRCFGMHMGLKLLLPLLTPLKYGGGAVSILAGNLWFLFFLLLMPACRTAITLWRMVASKRPLTDYLDALIVGVLPVAGSLAYPVQMYARYRELSTFLLRDAAARLGRWIPVYGGRDSRVEIGAIKAVNLVAECLEIGLAGTEPLRRRLAPATEATGPESRTIGFSGGRWNRLADEQLKLIAQTEAATQPTIDPDAEVAAGTRRQTDAA